MARRTSVKESAAALATRAQAVARQLARDYAGAECALLHESPLELLIATILSAQCTDQRVNLVTPELFRKYPTAQALAKAPLADLEEVIRSTGFYRNKARNIQGCCQKLVSEHGGKVPTTLDALTNLPGVGRKTANVVLGTAMGVASGVVVDTHVGRITRRLGLTKQADPVKVERDLMELLPQSEWINFSHRLIHHGRQVCLARKPKCETCTLSELCPRIGVPQAAAGGKRKTPAAAGSARAAEGKKAVRRRRV